MTLKMWAGPKAEVTWSARSRLSLQVVAGREPWRILIRGSGHSYMAGLWGKLEGRPDRALICPFPMPAVGHMCPQRHVQTHAHE